MLEDLPAQELVITINTRSQSISYLENSLSTVEDNPHQLAIISYALTLAQSDRADDFISKLEDLQQTEGRYFGTNCQISFLRQLLMESSQTFFAYLPEIIDSLH